MNDKVVSLSKAKDIGEDVSIKEVRFLSLVEQTLDRGEQVTSLPRSLGTRVARLREKARANLEAEICEM